MFYGISYVPYQYLDIDMYTVCISLFSFVRKGKRIFLSKENLFDKFCHCVYLLNV